MTTVIGMGNLTRQVERIAVALEKLANQPHVTINISPTQLDPEFVQALVNEINTRFEA